MLINLGLSEALDRDNEYSNTDGLAEGDGERGHATADEGERGGCRVEELQASADLL